MAIDRTAYNALVDDDGSNTLGSPWNKAAIKDVVLDPVDAALGGAIGIVVDNTTGTQHNFTLTGRTADCYWQWSVEASVLTLSGIAGGALGHRLIIKNASITGVITIPHYASGSSSPINCLYNIANSAPTSIGSMGSATYIHNGSNWVLTEHDQGGWITATFDAANFTTSSPGSSTWVVDAGDVTQLLYRLAGRTLTVAWSVNTSTVTGTPGALVISNAAYGGFSAACYQAMTLHGWLDSSASNKVGFAQTGTGTSVNQILIYKDGVVLWAATTNGVNTGGVLTFPVS